MVDERVVELDELVRQLKDKMKKEVEDAKWKS